MTHGVVCRDGGKSGEFLVVFCLVGLNGIDWFACLVSFLFALVELHLFDWVELVYVGWFTKHMEIFGLCHWLIRFIYILLLSNEMIDLLGWFG